MRLGVDEVGRGAFAGPLVVCVVRESRKINRIRILTDSKKLSSGTRKLIVNKYKNFTNYSVGIVWPHEIDRLGMTKSTWLAIDRALRCFNIFYGLTDSENLICDGRFKFSFNLVRNFESIVKADLKYKCVSMASILAKVYRDEMMNLYGDVFRIYNFKRNAGYGTLEHRRAICNQSSCRLHRTNFLRKLNEKNFTSRKL